MFVEADIVVATFDLDAPDPVPVPKIEPLSPCSLRGVLGGGFLSLCFVAAAGLVLLLLLLFLTAAAASGWFVRCPSPL